MRFLTLYLWFVEIRIENKNNTEFVSPSIDTDSIAKLNYNLYKNHVVEGEIFPQLHTDKTCTASKVNAFIIGPSGEIYKCWNHVSDESKIIGYISKEEIVGKTTYLHFMNSCMWYNDSECINCFFMPICQGKCVCYEEINKYHNGKFDLCRCLHKNTQMLEKCLERYYESTL